MRISEIKTLSPIIKSKNQNKFCLIPLEEPFKIHLKTRFKIFEHEDAFSNSYPLVSIIDYHQLPRPGIEGCSANVIIVITKQSVIIISNLHCVYQVVI